MSERDELARMALAAKIERALANLAVMECDVDGCRTCGGTGWISMNEPCPDCRCPTCGGVGYVRADVPLDHPLFGELLPCPENCDALRQMQENRRGVIRKYAALPEEYAGLTLASFDALPPSQREGKELARRFVEVWVNDIPNGGWVNMGGDTRNWLILHGLHGRGKTGLAAAASNALTETGQQSMYIRLQDFIEAVQKRYGKAKSQDGFADDFGSDSAEDVVDTVRTSPVLIIDEFDVPDIRENKLAIVEKIIRFRHGNRLPTLMTTNLNAPAFEQRWGPTIASVTNARAHWVLVDGPSLRPRAAEWRG